MKSMTGYGKGTRSENGFTVSAELRAVNHRFLDLGIKVPKSLGFLEESVRKILSQNFARGHIDLYLTLTDTGARGTALKIDFGLAEKYVHAAHEISSLFGLINDFSTEKLMRCSDVITAGQAELDEDAVSVLTAAALQDAADALTDMREREGEAVKLDLAAKLDSIEEGLEKIILRAAVTANSYREKLEARMREILDEVPVDEAKLLNEAAFYADRIAIDEEIVRLKTHINHTREMLQSREPVGRKLDFIVQEFNREVNTIGSKCNDLEISSVVLEMKNDIEKLREQVQNIE
ncbi:MAG: YicC family protein [Clostridiaceae bacterium]|nr:YicC family protein [Clostridiaceae bacterium]